MNTHKRGHFTNSVLRIGFALAAMMLCIAVQRARSAPQQAAPIKITTAKLGDVTAGRPYSELIESEGGKQPLIFSATGLPDGLAIRNFSDRISGISTAVGEYSVVIKITDSTQPTPQSTSVTLPLKVVPAQK